LAGILKRLKLTLNILVLLLNYLALSLDMLPEKAHIIAQLKKDLQSAFDHKNPLLHSPKNDALGFMEKHFPNSRFPVGAMHEFLCNTPEDIAGTSGFISALVSSIFPQKGYMVWISEQKWIFPPALKFFNIEPDQIIFITPSRPKDCLWVIEESLKCSGLSVVIAEMNGFNFINSRRFQLAVEESNVTGFLLNQHSQPLASNACIGRWKIKSLPSEPINNIPGIGFPRWQVELQKMRHGKKGIWEVEWNGKKLLEVLKSGKLYEEELEKKVS
jgi:protein ImuA